MRLIFILFSILTFANISFAQEDNSFYEGFKEIKLNAPLSSIKHLIKGDKIEHYFGRISAELDMKAMKKESIEFGYEFDPKDYEVSDEWKTFAYSIKLKKDYRGYFGVKVEAIEIQVNEENKISNILFCLNKTDNNVDLIAMKLLETLGSTFCSSGVNGPPVLYCKWETVDSSIKAFDWDGIGETDFDEFIWIEYKKSTY